MGFRTSVYFSRSSICRVRFRGVGVEGFDRPWGTVGRRGEPALFQALDQLDHGGGSHGDDEALDPSPVDIEGRLGFFGSLRLSVIGQTSLGELETGGTCRILGEIGVE